MNLCSLRLKEKIVPQRQLPFKPPIENIGNISNEIVAGSMRYQNLYSQYFRKTYFTRASTLVLFDVDLFLVVCKSMYLNRHAYMVRMKQSHNDRLLGTGKRSGTERLTLQTVTVEANLSGVLTRLFYLNHGGGKFKFWVVWKESEEGMPLVLL